MLIRTRCDHCQAFAEVSDVKLGQMIVCAKCDGQFVMKRRGGKEDDVFAVADVEADVQSITTSATRAVWKDGKHDLTLSSPPEEDWNLKADDDEPSGQRFELFRPSRKELAPFLDQEDADDGSLLLVLGLVGCGAIGALLLLALLFLCTAF